MKQDKSGKLSDYSWTTDLIRAVKCCRLRPIKICSKNWGNK